MKQFLLILALVGCGEKSPTVEIAAPIVEREIREILKKPDGDITKADLETVKGLVLAFTQLTDAGLKEVVTKLPHLLNLNLAGTQITDAGLKELAKLQQLEALRFDSCPKITDAGLKEVAKLEKLHFLILYRTEITDASLKEVAKLKQLKDLELGGTSVTKAGVAKLKKALPKCNISSDV